MVSTLRRLSLEMAPLRLMWEVDLDKNREKPQHWEIQVSLDTG